MTGKAGKGFLPTLHALRGIMAVWVLLFHTSPQGLGPLQVTKYGYLAVDIFFILSGYVLMRGQGSQSRLNSTAGLVSFWRARWWRVFPLYLVSVALSLVYFLYVRGTWPDGSRVVESLLLLDGWARPGIGVNSAAWSLGVEWLGYFAFPVIVYCVAELSCRQRFAVLVALSICATIYMALIGEGWDQTVGLPAVVRMAAGFIGGCLLYTLHVEEPAWLHHRSDLLAFVAFFGLLGLLLAGLSLLVFPVMLLIVYALAQHGPWSTTLLCNVPILFLGRISFALYITHQIVIKTVTGFTGFPQSFTGKVASTILAVSCAVVVATFLCLSVEEPLRRWSHNKGKVRPAMTDLQRIRNGRL